MTTFEDMITQVLDEKENNPDRNIILLLCGNSGSGKSTFEEKLVNHNDDKFFKLPQCTTRDRRPGEVNNYYFLTEEVYENICSKLIARIRGNSFNGSCYGTIPVYDKDRVNTCIASYEAIYDIIDSVNTESMLFRNTSIYALLFNIDYNKAVHRNNRDEGFIKKEQEELINSLEIGEEEGIIKDIGYWDYNSHNRFPEMYDVNLED